MGMRTLIVAILLGATLPAPKAGSAIAQGAATCAPPARAATGGSARLTKANNGFGFRLLRRIVGREAAGNAFISPASLGLGLEMAYDGSRGKTQQAMAGTLGLGRMTPAEVRTQAASLLTALSSGDGKVRLAVADALWARAGVRFRQRFVQEMARSFGARVTTADFNSPATIEAINSWVSCATRGTIGRIVDSFSRDEVMLLLNALYFRGDWSTPFPSANTRPGTFSVASGGTVNVPMMANTAAFAYSEGAGYQAIALPYGDGRFSMKIVLPRPGVTAATLLGRLTPATWQSWTGSMTTTEVALKVPRFTIRNDRLLNGDLSAMGMAVAFHRGANFTGICERCLLSRVIHKTYLQVDEKGTTASAVTGIVVGITAVPANRAVMTVDRPFILGLEDRQTGTLLFAGVVNDPTR